VREKIVIKNVCNALYFYIFFMFSAIFKLNVFTLCLKNLFLTKDATRSHHVRKATYELNKRLKAQKLHNMS